MTKPHVFIATPMYGGQGTGPYISSLVQTPSTLAQYGLKLSYQYLMNESVITRARNHLAHAFLQTEATHLLWIDADIGFNPIDIITMLKADKDIIAGLYPRKELNWQRITDAVNNGIPPEQLDTHQGSFVLNMDNVPATIKGDEPFEVTNIAGGFMLIKRAVLETLADKTPTYTRFGEKVNEYYALSIDPEDNQLLPEDFHFCKLARNNGYKIHAAPWVRLNHVGTHIYNGTGRDQQWLDNRCSPAGWATA